MVFSLLYRLSIRLILMVGLFVAFCLLVGCALNEQARTAGAFPAKDTSNSEARMTQYRSLEHYVITNDIQKEDKSPSISAKLAGNTAITFAHDTAYIEFDEQGDFFDREQLRIALDNVPTSGRHLVLIYVHGWENNTESDDAAKFNTFVAHLNRSLYFRYLRMKESSPWRVYGVYLSWRGTLIPPSYRYLPHNGTGPESLSSAFSEKENPLESWIPLKYLLRDAPKIGSFWSREADANKVAGAPMEEAINSLAAKARQSSDPSRVILIGHSFGAYVVEKTILQDYSTLLCFPDTNGNIHPPVDFVVLLNSAAPSVYAKEFIDALKWRHVGKSDHPFVVSVSSETDDATKIAFPGGTIVGSAFDIGSYQDAEKSNNYHGADQKIFFTHTPGHSGYLASHDAVPKGPLSGRFSTGGLPDEWLLSRNLNIDPDMYADLPVEPKSTEFLAWGDVGYGKTKGTSGDSHPQLWQLVPTQAESGQKSETIYNTSPYWIIRVPPQIIDGHTDVWCPNSVNLVAALFRMSGLLGTSGKPNISVGSYPTSPTKPDDLVHLRPYPANNSLLH